MGAIFVHAAANLINTYGDYAKGVDVKGSADDRAIVDGLVTAAQIYRLIVACVAAALAVLVAFLYIHHSQRQATAAAQRELRTLASPLVDFVLLCAAGLFLGYAYTAPPFYWKYRGLGDICIVVAYGPLLVAGGYYCQLYTLPPLPALWFSLYPGLLTEAILHVNNTRDQVWDARCGAVTLPMKLGERWSGFFFVALYAITFAGNVLSALLPSAFLPLPVGASASSALGQWSWAQAALLLPLLLIPSSLDLIRRYYAKEFKDLCPRCGEFGGKYGVLQSIALVAWGMQNLYAAKH